MGGTTISIAKRHFSDVDAIRSALYGAGVAAHVNVDAFCIIALINNMDLITAANALSAIGAV